MPANATPTATSTRCRERCVPIAVISYREHSREATLATARCLPSFRSFSGKPRRPMAASPLGTYASGMKALGKHASGLRLERMKASPRYRDGGFQNLVPIPAELRSGAMPGIGEFLCGGNRRTPSAPLPARDPREVWTRASETGLRATWLGHSTVLIEMDGLRILTDPVWGERASPMTFAGPKRFQPVPVTVPELPRLDVVLISHDHYDHLDYPTLLELAKIDVPFVTSLGVGAHLESWGIAA